MAVQNKTFEMLVQFDPIELKVKARNKREAKKKVIEKIKAMSAFKVMDKRNYFLDEVI
jgi:hypothetical protein